MSFESEVLPLFIGGVLIVSILELAIGCALFKKKRTAQVLFSLHTGSMLVGFGLLCRSIFAPWLGISPGIASISNSMNIGLFGVLWFFSVLLLLAAIHEANAGK